MPVLPAQDVLPKAVAFAPALLPIATWLGVLWRPDLSEEPVMTEQRNALADSIAARWKDEAADTHPRRTPPPSSLRAVDGKARGGVERLCPTRRVGGAPHRPHSGRRPAWRAESGRIDPSEMRRDVL